MNWLQKIKLLWANISSGIETLYAAHGGALYLIALAVTIAGTYFGWRALKPAPKASEGTLPLESTLRLRLLHKVQNERVDPRLRQGLREAIRVDLGLTETPSAVLARLRMYARLESSLEEECPIHESILSIFEQRADGRLLILGEPGTGKTNLLLELAQSLIAHAMRDPARPLPIVFSLPRWTLGQLGNSQRTLAEWLKDDLVAEYGVSRPAADALVREDIILPLLDGLDEVAYNLRAKCVDAIHRYQADRNLKAMVVCCRSDEYAELGIKLDLAVALRVETLTRTDVERELAKSCLQYVRRAMEIDPELWAVVDTPLWLHVLYGAAQVEWPKRSSTQTIRERLYARFVEYALGRAAEGSPRKRTSREPLLHRLGWLAAEMQRRHQAQFDIEELDLTWLVSGWARRAAGSSVALLAGSVFGAVFGLFGALVFGLVFGPVGKLTGGLVTGLIGGVVFGWDVLDGRIEEMESGPDMASGKMAGLVVGLFIGLVFAAVLFVSGRIALDIGLIGGLMGGLIVGTVFGLVFNGVFIEPFEGLSPRAFLISLAVVVAMAAWKSIPAVRSPSPDDLRDAVAIICAASACVAVNLGLDRGGLFALTHYIVRVSLAWSNFAPLGYVAFLDEAVGRLFLIRRGSSYEFFHITFRDHMAHIHGPKANSS